MSPLDTFTWALMTLLMLGRGDVVSGFYALCWLVHNPVGRAAPWEYTRTFRLLSEPESDAESEEAEAESETEAGEKRPEFGPKNKDDAPVTDSDTEDVVVTPRQRCKQS